MRLCKNFYLWTLIIIGASITVAVCGRNPIRKWSDVEPLSNTEYDSLRINEEKRTFCNAFTGCGRKRYDRNFENSNIKYVKPNDADEENSRENALQALRDILAQAKLLEALQIPNYVRRPPKYVSGEYYGRKKRWIGDAMQHDSNSELPVESDIE